MKTLIYPITYNNRELLTQSNLLDNKFSNMSYITHSNLKPFFDKICTTYDICCVDIDDDFLFKLNECSQVIFLPGLEKQILLEAINLAHEKKKEIYIFANEFKTIENDIDIKTIHVFSNNIKDCIAKPPVIYDINIPIIGVMGLGDHCEKFTCELMLRNHFSSRGYKVLQYGSKEISPLFGFEPLPNYVFDQTKTITTRAIQLNHDIAQVVAKEQPDLIILGCPGGIMPIAKTYLNDFGEYPQVISNAMAIDYTVFGLYYQEQISKEYVDYIGNILQYKFGTELSAICISNTAFEVDFELGGQSLKYFHLDAHNVSELNYEIESNIVPTFTLMDKYTISSIFSHLLDSMTKNIATI